MSLHDFYESRPAHGGWAPVWECRRCGYQVRSGHAPDPGELVSVFEEPEDLRTLLMEGHVTVEINCDQYAVWSVHNS